jgi:hypothetical protein
MDSPTATWSLMSVVSTGYIFLLIYIGNYDETEKRDRLHVLLPIPQQKLGVARIGLLLLLQAGFAVNMFLSLTRRPQARRFLSCWPPACFG